MRTVLFAILVAIPTALITWVVTKGIYGQPGRRCASCTEQSGSAGDPDVVLLSLLEHPIKGFDFTGEVQLYDGKGLFNYINGAAPLFIERGFRMLAAAEMTVSGGELTCEVYDMADAKNAAAIFAAESTPIAKTTELGDEARTASMSLVFRNGPYYAKLTAFDAQAEADLPRLAKTLIARMP